MSQQHAHPHEMQRLQRRKYPRDIAHGSPIQGGFNPGKVSLSEYSRIARYFDEGALYQALVSKVNEAAQGAGQERGRLIAYNHRLIAAES